MQSQLLGHNKERPDDLHQVTEGHPSQLENQYLQRFQEEPLPHIPWLM